MTKRPRTSIEGDARVLAEGRKKCKAELLDVYDALAVAGLKVRAGELQGLPRDGKMTPERFDWISLQCDKSNRAQTQRDAREYYVRDRGANHTLEREVGHAKTTTAAKFTNDTEATDFATWLDRVTRSKTARQGVQSE